jgi:DHA1 family bicyclomycin/chloramphenicol resistance-like MFS transporter
VTVVLYWFPVIAPLWVNWPGLLQLAWIFYIQVVISVLVSFWFWKRQPELSIEIRKISLQRFYREFKELI